MQAMAIFQNTSGHLVQTPAHLLPPQSCVDRVKPSFAVQSLKPFFFTMWSISRWTATLNNHQLLQPPVEVLAPSAPGLRGWPDRSSNMVTTKWREYLCIGYQSLLYPMPMVFGCKCLEAFFSGMVKGQLRPPRVPLSAHLSQLLALRKLKPRMRPQWTGCQPPDSVVIPRRGCDFPWVFPTRGWSWNTTPRSRNELVG